jgi:hypothetical protein
MRWHLFLDSRVRGLLLRVDLRRRMRALALEESAGLVFL